jgi:flagellar hook-basal body complex protein FliE
MSISGISNLPGIGALPLKPLSAPAAPTGAAKPDFSTMVAQGLEKLQATQANSDNLAVKATTGDLSDIHEYMIASNEATVATQLTVAVRNKAVEAFTEIMRMQV